MASFNDPLVSRQWHFKLLGNINAIWDEFSGAGVNVGVYDGGLQAWHPDLDGRYDPSLHFVYKGVTYDPRTLYPTPGQDDDGHGTSVAGIIAAEGGNGIGGVGVAWGATLTGVNILTHPSFRDGSAFSDELFLASIRHAATFDIMSNSWGYDAFFLDFLNRADDGSFGTQIEAAFGHVVENGRNGLGTLVVKAAGNDATNSNGEGFSGSRFIIDVAAVDPAGQVTYYSNYGTNILVSAGAAEVTTDLMGLPGYGRVAGSAGDYTFDFGGTSAATPVVSGVIALMLDANENLGWRDVREILATSAALTGSVVTGNQSLEITGTYFQSSAGNGDSWNDGGRGYSQDYGFGRVDAFAAVRMAEAWALFGEAKTSANEQSLTVSEGGPTTFTFSGVSGSMSSQPPTLSINDHLWVEHIDVTIAFDIPSSLSNGDIEFTLHAPDGTYFSFAQLVDNLTDISTDGFSWTFGISQALGLDAFGNWFLTATIMDGSSIGTTTVDLLDFKLDFYGSAWDLDNVHHITGDYLLAWKKDASGQRDGVISDTNGGTDWLNMSSIAGAVTATLDALGGIAVAGKKWATIAAGTILENIVTGDGKDKLTGSALANEIHSMRGNDAVYGLGGNDTLEGGAGNDKLFGGDDNDQLTGGAGKDALDGGLGNDTIFGGDGNDKIAEAAGGGDDVVYAGRGRDTVTLGAGNDTFFDETETGEAGGDKVYGGDGNDSLFGDGGADRLYGDAGDDLVFGGVGNDTLAGGNDNDVLVGGEGNDSVLGDAGNDVLTGEAGNDILNGGTGIDSLTGGAGDDVLTGGADADTFVFLDEIGRDRITDFVDNVDQLYFSAGFWGGLASVVDFVDTYAAVVGSNVIFDFEDGNVLTLTGVRSLDVLYDDVMAIA